MKIEILKDFGLFKCGDIVEMPDFKAEAMIMRKRAKKVSGNRKITKELKFAYETK